MLFLISYFTFKQYVTNNLRMTTKFTLLLFIQTLFILANPITL